MSTPTRMIITGVPSYAQRDITLNNGKTGPAGCGPIAALMLMAWYDRRYGFTKLIPSGVEADPQPEDLLNTLRLKMDTMNLELDNDGKQEYGMTLPPNFKAGLHSYISERYKVDVSTKASTGFNTLEGVFNKSKELILEGNPHVLLLDWDGSSGIFPTHYVVVVGFTTNNGLQNLIVNPGFGYPFQAVDMKDKKVKPARLYWIEMQEKADGARDGHPIGPMDNYDFQKLGGSGDGLGLIPTVRPHFDKGNSSTWRISDRMENGIDTSNLWQCKWYD